MDQQKKLGLAIIGGGRGGLELLRLFYKEKGIEMLGVADIRPHAPAILYAQAENIFTTTDLSQLLKQDGLDLIADVTGRPEIHLQILAEKDPQVEVLGGISAKLMWKFIEVLEEKIKERAHELKEVQGDLFRNKLFIMQQISSGISYELRGPLEAIKNSVACLSRNLKSDEKSEKYLNIITEEIGLAEKIVEDLMHMVKPDEWVFAANHLQQQLIQSEKLAHVGVMAAGMAHEVINPLAVILGKAEMILEEEDRASINIYAQEIIDYAEKASGVVKGITYYSRAPSRPGSEIRIFLNDQLDKAIKLSKYSTPFDHVELITDYHDLPPVCGNAGEIQQVFVNLICNAVQSMSGRGRLFIRSGFEGGAVTVSIRDTGAGIKGEHLKELFTPFFTTKEPGKGTGLGLNIVHKIITGHGGSINVESEEGQGATFIVRLPPVPERLQAEEARGESEVKQTLSTKMP